MWGYLLALKPRPCGIATHRQKEQSRLSYSTEKYFKTFQLFFPISESQKMKTLQKYVSIDWGLDLPIFKENFWWDNKWSFNYFFKFSSLQINFRFSLLLINILLICNKCVFFFFFCHQHLICPIISCHKKKINPSSEHTHNSEKSAHLENQLKNISDLFCKA